MKENLKHEVVNYIESVKCEFFAISNTMYENPEVGLKEFRAVELMRSALEKHGFAFQKGVAGMETAFKATLEGKPGGPTLGIIAEYDALPRVGHGCGHNIIAASAVAAAVGLSQILTQISGRLVVFGTPNEEAGSKGGKISMVEQGVFNGVDSVIKIHPTASVRSDQIIHPGFRSLKPNLALSAVEVRFKGKAAHSSNAPDRGINALDAVLQTFFSLNAFRDKIRNPNDIHGIITLGGETPNIIPEEAAAFFFVRGVDTKTVFRLIEKLECFSRAAELATGATLEFRPDKHYLAASKPNYTLAGCLEKNLRSLGEKVQDEEETTTGGASSDSGNVSQIIPESTCRIAIAPRGTLNHSSEIAAATISDAGRRGLLVGAKVMAMSCIDLFLDADLRSKVKEEFISGR